MRLSTISKRSRAKGRPSLAEAIGEELKRLRLQRGLSQAAVGRPLSRAFVSSVEKGRIIPSIPALALLTERLGIDLGTFFTGVNRDMTVLYTGQHDRHEGAATGGRR